MPGNQDLNIHSKVVPLMKANGSEIKEMEEAFKFGPMEPNTMDNG